jgi:hypothetical protein
LIVHVQKKIFLVVRKANRLQHCQIGICLMLAWLFQNLCLKAHELGLGTVVVGFLDHEKCNQILNVPLIRQ